MSPKNCGKPEANLWIPKKELRNTKKELDTRNTVLPQLQLADTNAEKEVMLT